jgi:membrane-associated phospholipid phosphatase
MLMRRDLFKSNLIALFDFLGTPPFYFSVAAVLAIFRPSAAWRLVVAVVLAEALCAAIKLATRTERPIPHPRPRRTLYEQYDASSFPSAHTARIAACAGSLALSLDHPGWIVAAVLSVLAVAYGRVAQKCHYPVDVAAGGLIGILIVGFVHAKLFA